MKIILNKIMMNFDYLLKYYKIIKFKFKIYNYKKIKLYN